MSDTLPPCGCFLDGSSLLSLADVGVGCGSTCTQQDNILLLADAGIDYQSKTSLPSLQI